MTSPLVPSVPSGPPPAARMRTSPPAIWSAISARPSARAAECDTNTIPITAPLHGGYSTLPNAVRQQTGEDTWQSSRSSGLRRSCRHWAAVSAGSASPSCRERLGLAKGTVHGLLKALQQERFVEQEAESGKYQLGAALLQLGNIYLDVNELRGRSLRLGRQPRDPHRRGRARRHAPR